MPQSAQAALNPNFLPPQPPASASLHRLDFATTNPPIPKYKNYLAAVIDNAFTEAECKELICLAEATTLPPNNPKATPTWERAMINMGNGQEALSVDSRNCSRIIYDTPVIADRLLARLMPFLRDLGIDVIDSQALITGLAGRNKTYRLTRLNERLRFLKYVGGEYFRPHWDGKYRTPDGKEFSYFTVHVYLNGEGEQDMKELGREMKKEREREERWYDEREDRNEANLDPDGKLLGGATSFLPRYEDKDGHVRVFPKTGSVLVFQQSELLHSGDPVFRGTKYTLRTDVMYEKVSG